VKAVSPQAFRATAARGIPRDYQAARHVAGNLGAGAAVAVAAALATSGLRAAELLAVPATLVLLNLLEYASHRWLMHRRTRVLPYAFEAHVLRHHASFARRAMHVGSPREIGLILFGAREVALFALATLPPFALVVWLGSRNAALLATSAVALHFVLYEALHLVAHVPAQGLAAHPWLAASRRRHAHHHGSPRENFNVTFPLGDWLFGTLRDPASVRGRR
jgi:Fatty acid hydroxylase superfamily